MGGSYQERIRMVRSASGWGGPVRNASGWSGAHQDGRGPVRTCQDDQDGQEASRILAPQQNANVLGSCWIAVVPY